MFIEFLYIKRAVV